MAARQSVFICLFVALISTSSVWFFVVIQGNKLQEIQFVITQPESTKYIQGAVNQELC